MDQVDLVLVFDGSASYASTYNAFTAAKNSAADLISRMRVGDRIGVVRFPDVAVQDLVTITSDATKATVTAKIQAMAPGGACAIGAGLQKGQTLLTTQGAANHLHAMILFSAGEENPSPTAAEVLPSIAAAKTNVFTMGFTDSAGNDLLAQIATGTTGAFFHLYDPTDIGPVVMQIWNVLTGNSFLFTGVGSTGWQVVDPDSLAGLAGARLAVAGWIALARRTSLAGWIALAGS